MEQVLLIFRGQSFGPETEPVATDRMFVCQLQFRQSRGVVSVTHLGVPSKLCNLANVLEDTVVLVEKLFTISFAKEALKRRAKVKLLELEMRSDKPFSPDQYVLGALNISCGNRLAYVKQRIDALPMVVMRLASEVHGCLAFLALELNFGHLNSPYLGPLLEIGVFELPFLHEIQLI